MSFLALTEFSGRELSEFLSAYYLCAKAHSQSLSQNSPSLPQNSVRLSEFSSPNSTLETVFRPFPRYAIGSSKLQVLGIIELEGAPEGATSLLHFSKCSRPFIQSIKSPF